jgi:predicted PhzF superfamily epimerase YddE/YHI9
LTAGIDVSLDIWHARVFGLGGRGGNETAIVSPAPAEAADMQAIAAELGVPDTAFVVDLAPGRIDLRTFSPHGEVALCVQTSLAAAVAAAAPFGEVWTVRHPGGGEVFVRREDWAGTDRVWARLPADLGAPEPLPALSLRLGAEAVRLGGPRPRIAIEVPTAAALRRLAPSPAEVLGVCAEEGVEGLVFFAVSEPGAQVRVFTTSLAGEEDSGTGGAVAGLGRLLIGRRPAGEIAVVQRPGDPDREGHMTLSIGGVAVELGAEVEPLPGRELA